MVEAYTIYNLYKKQRRKGSSASWEDVIPSVLSIDGDGTMPEVIVKRNATECGYHDIYDPIYKWEDADETDFICDECEVEPETDYYKEYLTIEALDSGSFKWTGSIISNTVSYSVNNGNWTALSNSFALYVSAGDKVRFKGNCTPYSINGIGRFSGTTASYIVYGNAHSLMYGDDFVGNDTLKGTYTFEKLFMETKLVDASNLILPATTLVSYCYESMFEECTSLTKAPKLPATTLVDACYISMFYGCTALTKAPALHATTLAQNCYAYMFTNCSSLNEITTMQLDTPNSGLQYQWVSNVSSSGTIYLNNNITWNPESYRGVNGIPNGWEVIKI